MLRMAQLLPPPTPAPALAAPPRIPAPAPALLLRPAPRPAARRIPALAPALQARKPPRLPAAPPRLPAAPAPALPPRRPAEPPAARRRSSKLRPHRRSIPERHLRRSGEPSMSAIGRYCCKSPKSWGDKFLAGILNKPQSPIDVATGSLPKSPVSLSLGDEVPHVFIRKSHL